MNNILGKCTLNPHHRECVKTCLKHHSIYNVYVHVHVHCIYMYMYTGEMMYVHVHVGDKKWMQHTSLYDVSSFLFLQCHRLGDWSGCQPGGCLDQERGQV